MSYQRIILLVVLFCMLIVTGSAVAQETAPSTGHEYEYVEAEGDGITWEEAREAASQRMHDGKQGYLVTITSQEEQEFVQSLTTKDAWIGASDAAEEGTWRWVTGPEGKENNGQGRHFFTQSGEGGTAVNGQYTKWRSGEPNNDRGVNNDKIGENYAHLDAFRDANEWNDNQGNSNLSGYIVEYGGLDGNRKIQTLSTNGHHYQFAETDGVTWQEAREATSQRTHNGKQGYLATITSREEQELIQSLTTKDAWIGASDATEEGTWRWVTGPEGKENNGQGRHFFTQSGEGGTAVNGQYTKWRSGEPNNDRGVNNDKIGENYAHLDAFRDANEWNDNQGNSALDGYIIEYGGMNKNQVEPEPDDRSESRVDDKQDSEPQELEPTFTFNPSPAEVGQQVAFSAADSTVSNGEIISYNWKFGNGETATGETVTHTYTKPGGYNVKLTVITNKGESKTTTQPISVESSGSSNDDGISVEVPGFGFGSTIMSLVGLVYIIGRRSAA